MEESLAEWVNSGEFHEAAIAIADADEAYPLATVHAGFRLGFRRGWSARDSEVNRLQAKLSIALKMLEPFHEDLAQMGIV